MPAEQAGELARQVEILLELHGKGFVETILQPFDVLNTRFGDIVPIVRERCRRCIRLVTGAGQKNEKEGAKFYSYKGNRPMETRRRALFGRQTVHLACMTLLLDNDVAVFFYRLDPDRHSL